ncbi:hypothetical protein [Roseinatronobacter monicus]|uniref:Uncharacterized protein n=1 Tax=Roseinatronobacter monicus TaxID=393481 RepID=A0A543K4C4_9RHOB|nr:hypothetical protein [Roseinatronobacter monicus]TQM89937.1 hypothetical protein BD293_4255 [Roseinatronobacter monicus]
MGKLSWNKFTADHPTAPAFTTTVSSSLPKAAPFFDRDGNKLPTPYGLLVEWLKANLAGDWTSMTKNRLVIVKAVEHTDAAMIMKRFPAIGAAKKTSASASTSQINYTDHDYGKLAVEMGYKLS